MIAEGYSVDLCIHGGLLHLQKVRDPSLCVLGRGPVFAKG